MQSIHGISGLLTNKKLDCDVCGKTVTSRGNLYHHKRRMHNEKQSNNKCNICNKQFKIKSDLTGHVKQVHEKGNIQCNICNVNFKNKSDLRKHVHSQHKEIGKKCVDCKKLFRSKMDLEAHYLKEHQHSSKTTNVNSTLDEPSCNYDMEDFETTSPENLVTSSKRSPQTSHFKKPSSISSPLKVEEIITESVETDTLVLQMDASNLKQEFIKSETII